MGIEPTCRLLGSIARGWPILLFAALLGPGSLNVVAQGVAEARATVSADLKQALAELNALNRRIADGKLPLAKRLKELENQTAKSRSAIEELRGQQDNQDVRLETLQSDIQTREKELDYLAHQMDDYIRFFETRVHIAELSEYRSVIDAGLDAASGEREPDASSLERQLDVVAASIGRVDALLGGKQFSGQALASDGTLEQGKFALLGPVALFASDESDEAGVARLEANALDPALQVMPEPYRPGVRDIVESGAGDLAFDATGGNAFRVAETEETLAQHMVKGGVVMVPILILAAMALAVGLWKAIELFGAKPAQTETVQEILDLLRDGKDAAAAEKSDSIGGPAGSLLVSAVKHARERKDLLEEILFEQILKLRPKLERMLAFIGLTAAVAPLLGLLGTVTGMIHTFRLIIIYGTGDARTLSTGISEALITTEFGLIVAVAALLVHGFLSRKAKGVIASMEQTAVAFVNGLSLRQESSAAQPDEGA